MAETVGFEPTWDCSLTDFESRMMIEPLKITTLLGGFFYRRRFELPSPKVKLERTKALGENYRRELEDKLI